jgi:hypothetical protein
LTRHEIEGGAAAVEAALAASQAEDRRGSLRLSLYHESMRMLLRRDDDPALALEVMCPEAVDPRPANYTPAPPRFAWNRSLQDTTWERDGDWWALREDQADFGYRGRVRLNDDGARLDMELTAYNHGEAELPAVRFTPCAGLGGNLVDIQHRRTFVVDATGALTRLGPLVEEYPYVGASVRGAPRLAPTPNRPRASRLLDLDLGDNVIIVRALDGRGAVVMGFEQAYEIGAWYVPCVHCEAYVGPVPAGEARTVRGFVAWLPGDEKAAYAYYREWKRQIGRERG